MKNILMTAFAVALAAGTANAEGYNFNGIPVNIQYWAGTGSNEVVVVVDFAPGQTYAFGYRWDGTASGWNALAAIDNAGALDVTATTYSWGHMVTNIAYPGATQTTGDDWGYWLGTGGSAWAEAMTGPDGRVLTDGSWDARCWSPIDWETWAHTRAPTTPFLAFGDADADGSVDDNDLGTLLSAWGTGTTWAAGDFNADSAVDDNDLGTLLGNWTGSAAAAPEPVSLVLLAIGGMGVLARRNRLN